VLCSCVCSSVGPGIWVMWTTAELVRVRRDLGLVGGSMGKVVDLMAIKDKDKEKMVRIIYNK
jgi:hypothetical protein